MTTMCMGGVFVLAINLRYQSPILWCLFDGFHVFWLCIIDVHFEINCMGIPVFDQLCPISTDSMDAKVWKRMLVVLPPLVPE